jgi:carbamoyl-phosphate synthase large subunit
MEHIERTGVHSGDSIAVYPAQNVSKKLQDRIFEITKKICLELNVRGLVNMQYVIYEGEVYVIEVNPRASRTVPYLSKVTGIPMCELATRTSFGEKLAELGYKSGVAEVPPYTAVKVPVFSFEKLTGLDTHLGPEMKSTGEVLGIGRDIQEALCKGIIAASFKMETSGGVLITVRNSDKEEAAKVARKFDLMGYSLYATKGTADFLREKGFAVTDVEKIRESSVNNTAQLLDTGKISYVISTSERGRAYVDDEFSIRRKALILGISCMTSVDTANALADSLMSGYNESNTVLIDINELRIPEANRIKLPAESSTD